MCCKAFTIHMHNPQNSSVAGVILCDTNIKLLIPNTSDLVLHTHYLQSVTPITN